MPNQSTSFPLWSHRRWGALLAIGCILATVAVLFARSFAPGEIVFANDVPLGFYRASAFAAPSNFLAIWTDLNWLGGNNGGLPPDISTSLLSLLKPVGYAKFFAPITILFLGICAWVFFRQLKLHWLACLLGGLAAALNSDLFTTSCWGVGTQAVCFGCFYLALAALLLKLRRWSWLKFALAGFAVGIGVMEGFDIGAIFSLVFAAHVFYCALTAEGRAPARIGAGVGRVAIVAACAGLISAQTVVGLIELNIKGVVGTEQDPASKARRWDFATQFSLPKREILSVVVPGLFGFRADSSALPGGDYWGAAGRDPSWDRYFESGEQGPASGGPIRFSGGGVYAGVLVVLIAAWAAAQSLRKQGSVFSLGTRKQLWFWLGLMLVSVLLAFGRHAPFYQFFYALPYSSAIRNPAKFMHVFSWVLAIVFAYGIDALSRNYLETKDTPKGRLPKYVKAWWAKAPAFDRKWTRACVIVFGVSLMGWLVYAASRSSLEAYLQKVQFGPESAKAIAGFSLFQVGRYLLYLVLSIGALTLILSGWLSGARAKWGAGLLGLLLLADLGLADRPWVIYWNYPQKYATDPIIDRLRQQPYEHRVAILPSFFRLPPQAAQGEQYLQALYGQEWLQHKFRYYDIQSLDIVQMRSVPEDYAAFEGALQPRSREDVSRLVARRWELTNTRYLLGLAGVLDPLNQLLDPEKHRFQIATRFDIVPRDTTRPTRPDEWSAVPSTNGAFALLDFTGALPRVQLYSKWQASTNDQLTLEKLASAGFDPAKSVLIANPESLPPSMASAPADAGSVQFTSYASKHILLHAKANVQSVLLLNDKFDPNWKVSVDGKLATLLRCNYLMRGVGVPPGEHDIEFRFLPSLTPFYVSLAGFAAALLCIGCVVGLKRPQPDTQAEAAPVEPAKR